MKIGFAPKSLLGLAAAALVAAALATPAVASWSLVWSDEFEGTALDAANWTPDIGNGCPNLCGWGNNELQYYRSQNVTVSGGNLVLTAMLQSYGGSPFTSGKVTTRGKHAFLYGRIEMRAKLPVGGGMWPAFWMMPQDDVYGSWAASGEIDIMESANAMTSVGGALHFGGSAPQNTYTSSSTTLGGASFADAFHTYAIEWEPDAIRWYVDGTLYMTRVSTQWYTNAAPGNPRAPFDQEFYILLNAAVGGNYTGCTNVSCVTATFPQQYLIDYVRVYQDIANEAPTVAITAPAPAATLPAGDIVITATAADGDGTIATVEFYNGSELLGADATEPYAFTWSAVPDGCYLITARANDDLGGYAEDSVDITVGAGCGQAPFLGTPFVLPTVIEVEDYDLGGEGVAYHDTDPANNGGQYRTAEAVDVQTCSDTGGGYNTGWTYGGEWLEYTIDVPTAGTYTVETRVSSLSGGGVFHLEFAGVDRTGDIAVPSTSNWQTWTTVTGSAQLEAGVQVMRFVATVQGFNVNSFAFTTSLSAVEPGLPPAGYVLHAAYPNPFNPSTTISYGLPTAAVVRLTIHDVSGRLVRTLVAAETVGAGHHDVVWNGRDQAGQIAAAGVYFYRLDAGGFVQTRRMALVK